MRLPHSGHMSPSTQAIYQPESSDLHRIIHELANVLQRCLALRLANESRANSEDEVARLRESVQQACLLVHRIAERVENMPCSRCTQKRPIRSMRF